LLDGTRYSTPVLEVAEDEQRKDQANKNQEWIKVQKKGGNKSQSVMNTINSEKGFTSVNKLLRSPNPKKVRFGIERDASECKVNEQKK
jgi:hypothetical protein